MAASRRSTRSGGGRGGAHPRGWRRQPSAAAKITLMVTGIEKIIFLPARL
jgi:hypothetical protein